MGIDKTLTDRIDKAVVARKVLVLGNQGALFQRREVRDAVGVASDDKSRGTAVYNVLNRLEKDGALEEVPSGRARNRYFMISDESRLRKAISVGRPSVAMASNGKLPVVPERLIRIESAVQDIQQRMDQFEARMEQLEAKVDHLIAVWS